MPSCDSCGETYSKENNFCPECGEPTDGDSVSEYAKSKGRESLETGSLDLESVIELVKGEEIVEARKPSYLNWYKHFLGAGLIVLFGLFAGVSMDSIPAGVGLIIFGVLVGGGICGYVWYERQKRLFVFTNRRFILVKSSQPILENIADVTDLFVREVWIDEITMMDTGSTKVERLISRISDGTLGHVAISTSGGATFTGTAHDAKVYDYEACARALRNARNKPVYNHPEVMAQLEEADDVVLERQAGD